MTQFADCEEASRIPQGRRVLLAMLAVDMGGRAAEELLLGKGQATMGAQSDIDEATADGHCDDRCGGPLAGDRPEIAAVGAQPITGSARASGLRGGLKRSKDIYCILIYCNILCI